MALTKWILALGLLTLCSPGCGPLRAPLNEDGSPMTVVVHVDANDGDLEPGPQAERREVAELLRGELGQALDRYGWIAELADHPDQVSLGQGVYLARVRIRDYTPGSPEAREAGREAVRHGGHVAVGGHFAIIFSKARLRLGYWVVDASGEVVARGRVSKASSVSWQRAVAMVAELAAEEITDDLD